MLVLSVCADAVKHWPRWLHLLSAKSCAWSTCIAIISLCNVVVSSVEKLLLLLNILNIIFNNTLSAL